MKKLFLLTALLAVTLFTSCQKEEINPGAGFGTLTYTVEVPSQLATKALGDEVDHIDQLVYAVYETDANGEMTSKILYQKSAPVKDGKSNVTLELLNDQKYYVLFWAQVANVWGTPANIDLCNITYPNEVLSNNENMAAFCGVRFIENIETEFTKDRTIILTRPFAQINIGTTVPEIFTVDCQRSGVQITGAGNGYNVATGEVAETMESALVFTENNVPEGNLTVQKVSYTYVAMNYIFPTSSVELSYDIYTDHGTVNGSVSNVPVKTNYRTNIVGNLLTSSAEYNIEIDQNWGTPENDYILFENWAQIEEFQYEIKADAPASTLAEVLAYADQQAKNPVVKSANNVEVTINLSGNVEWKTGAGIGSTPLLPEDSPIKSVIIEGNGKTFTATGSGVGSIRLANGGTLTFNNVKVVDLSVSYAENSWEYGYLEFAGKLAFNGCEFVNAIMMESENAAFVNCSFNSNDDNQYGVWVSDGTVSFNECTFTGPRGLKLHEAYGSEVVSVSVDNCLFSQISKKPGIALGTLNAATTVTVKNSKFDRCSAGDQNNYMYETDTDVTTFIFVFENNVRPVAEGVAVDNESNYLILNAEGMFWFANEVNVSKNSFIGKTVKLANDIDLENAVWTPIGQTGSTTFNGVFDGQNYTISNLNVNSDSQTGAHYSSGLFGWIETHSAGNGIIKNVKINGANVVGHHNCGALVGYITEENALVENCHVSNATISCSYANGDADGDKAGALIGNATVATTVKDCTASNSTVSSGRDAGQLIGAGKEANVTGCSATNVAVSSNGTGTGANIRNEVIGRLL